MDSPVTAVIAEPDPTLRRLLELVLERSGIEAVGYPDGSGTLAHLLGGRSCDILLIDFAAPATRGSALVAGVRDLPLVRRPFLTVGLGSEAFDSRSVDGSVVSCMLARPVDVELIGRVFSGVAAFLRGRSDIGPSDLGSPYEELDAPSDDQIIDARSRFLDQKRA